MAQNSTKDIVVSIVELMQGNATLMASVNDNVAYGRLPDETPLPGIIFQIVYLPIINTYNDTNIGPILGKVQFDVYSPYINGAIYNIDIVDKLFNAVNRKDLVSDGKVIGQMWADDKGMLSSDDKAWRTLMVFNLLTN